MENIDTINSISSYKTLNLKTEVEISHSNIEEKFTGILEKIDIKDNITSLCFIKVKLQNSKTSIIYNGLSLYFKVDSSRISFGENKLIIDSPDKKKDKMSVVGNNILRIEIGE